MSATPSGPHPDFVPAENSPTFGAGTRARAHHMRPHQTGWCTVGIRHKTALVATTCEDAVALP